MKHSIPAVQIALADGSNLVRSCLKSSLEVTGNYRVMYEASSGRELVTQLKSRKILPDICVIDLSMGPLNGYETLFVIKKKWPELKTIVISGHDHELLIAKVLGAGASCYLSKECTTLLLCEAIDGVLKKGYYHTEAISKIVFQRVSKKKSTPEVTDKELQFLCLCCSDLTQKEIAQRMGVATRTVDNYRDSLFDKFNKHTRQGLAMFASSTGLVHLSVDYLSTSGMLNEQ